MHRVLVVSILAILGSASSIPAQQFAELAKKPLPPNRPTWALALRDVDGDGDPDLVLGNGSPGSSQNRLYLNDGRGTFTDATASKMPPDTDDTLSVALGDVDGDGDLDLVLGNIASGAQQNKLYLNDGTGTFTNATAGRMPLDSDDTFAVVLGDVDGDGDLDLVLGNVQLIPLRGRQNRLYLNNGTGTFRDVTATHMPPDSDRTWAAALGDVNGDGHLDLLLGNARSRQGQQNRLYLNNGTGRFCDVTLSQMPTDSDLTVAVALGDVDGDVDLDLVLGNLGQNRLYLNDGQGTFTDGTAARMPTDNDATWAMASGDVDGDGDLDLLLGNAVGVRGQQNRLYLNDGQGTFTDATASRMPTDADTTYALALGDVDGDGDSDLLAGNVRDPNRLYLNLHRHLDAPLPARIGQPYPLDIYTKPGFAQFSHVALPLIAAAAARIPLPPFGVLGLDPQAMIILPTINVRWPVGKVTIPLTMPNDPGLVGATIYSQALILMNPVDPTRFTNVMADPIR